MLCGFEQHNNIFTMYLTIQFNVIDSNTQDISKRKNNKFKKIIEERALNWVREE